MSTLKEQYNTKIVANLMKQLDKKNIFEVPRIKKVTINSGLSSKRDSKFIETILATLTKISGQKPVTTKARLSEAGFKIREGQVVGGMLTIRGRRMWSFVDKMVSTIFPRVRDFRGIKESAVDASGNFNYGFTEHTAFPEIAADDIEFIHGLQVTITTTADTHEEGLALFKALGFPFKKEV